MFGESWDVFTKQAVLVKKHISDIMYENLERGHGLHLPPAADAHVHDNTKTPLKILRVLPFSGF